MRKLYENIKKVKISENKICTMLVIALILQIIPMLFIAKYNFPSVDDFSDGKLLKYALEEQNTFGTVLVLIFKEMYRYYMELEGRFVSIFFVYLQPASFGEKFYFVVPYIMLSIIVIADFLACNAIFGKLFGANRKEIAIISIVWISVSIQLLPSAVQSFYWYTGAVAYVPYYSLSLCSIYLSLLYLKGKNTQKNILYLIFNSIIAFIIGGGSFVSAILILLLDVIIIFLLIINGSKKWKALCIPFFVLTFTLVIAVTAPGNKGRMGGESIGIIATIWKAINFAVESANSWLSISVIIAMIFLVPILWKIAYSASFSFRYPALVTIISCGLYAAQFCPHAYGLGTNGPARLTNIIFFSFIFFLIFNLFYWLGWLNKKWKILNEVLGISCNGSYSLIFVIIIVMGLGLSCNALRNQFPPTSIAAIYSLVTGEAEQYYNENQERLILLKDDTQLEVTLKEHTKKPCILFWDDGGEDPDDWRNKVMAYFYGKDSVVIK